MIGAIFLIASWFIGGLAGRVRGSDLTPSHFVARFIVWGLPVGILVVIATLNPIYALAAIILAGVGASFGYWGDFNVTLPENRTWKNFMKLSAMGCIRFAPLFVASCFVGLQWNVILAVLAGFSFYPAYVIGDWASKTISPKLKVGNKYLLDTFSEWGEFFFWGTIFVALAAGLFL